LVPSGGQSAKPRGLAGRVERPPPTFSTALAFYSSCRHVSSKSWAKLTQNMASQPRSLADRPILGPFQLGVWPTWSMCQIHPRGDDHFDIWSTLLCHPLKCSNLVPKFLKSNKHYNRGTRLVDKVNTWLFYTFTRHVGA
jgi:hypothetical protein